MHLIHAVSGNTLWLDGGAMFGNVPRAVWSQWCPSDGLGRIQLTSRALLVDEGRRKVLLETGIGAFFEPRLRDRFGVVEPQHVLLDSLSHLGLTDADIDVVVLSHLHFDHAGGVLAPWQEGRTMELLFENAYFVVGATALARAKAPHRRDRASFIVGLPEALEASGRLLVVESERCELLGEAYSFRETFGHTPGMLHTTIHGDTSSIFFCADLIPGIPWLHLPVTMGYDRNPERLIDEKQQILKDLSGTQTWLFFTHDPNTAAARVEHDHRGRYRAVEERTDFGPGFDLDS